MGTLEALFHQKAASFDAGDLARATQSIDTPTSIFMGDKLVFIEDQAALVRATGQVRANLIEQGYHSTTFEILTQKIVGARSVCVSLRWLHLRQCGSIMNTVMARYYCTKYEKRGWRVSIVEFDRTGRDVLTKGLVLA